MKNSGVEWIGEIPDGWEVKRGKELFFEINDRCKNPENYPLLSVSEYYGVAPKSEKIEEGDFITHAETLDGYKICQKGDIVQNIMLAWKRATGMSNYEGLISPAYCIYRPYKSIDSKYYHYLFRTDVYADLIKQYSTGIIDSRLRLYPAKFLSLKYAYPPKSTQQCIATYLDKKCSKIEETIQNQQQVIEKLKAYKQSLITEAVTGKIKIKNGKVCDKYESYKESGVEWIGKIPSEWNCPKIKYLHKGLTDGTHGTYNRLSNGYLLLSSKNVRDNCIEISDNESFISEEDFKEITANGFPQKDDVLLCCIGASIGRCTIYDLDETVAFQRSVIMIRCNEKIVPKFLMYALKSSYVLEQENVLINQSAQAGLYQGLVSKIYITISSVSEQKEISNYLDKKCTAIDTAIEQKQKLIEKLTEYKKSLIYECVTGKKEI